jgi:hypothetical protein
MPLQQHGQDMLDSLSDLKPTLVERYTHWLATHPNTPFQEETRTHPPPVPRSTALSSSEHHGEASREWNDSRPRQSQNDYRSRSSQGVLPDAQPPAEPSTSGIRNARSDLDSALDHISQVHLTASQHQALFAFLNASADGITEASQRGVQISTSLPQSSSGELREDAPDLATILNVISRSQLSLRERRALANNLLWPNQLTPGLTRGNTPPPAYSE